MPARSGFGIKIRWIPTGMVKILLVWESLQSFTKQSNLIQFDNIYSMSTLCQTLWCVLQKQKWTPHSSCPRLAQTLQIGQGGRETNREKRVRRREVDIKGGGKGRKNGREKEGINLPAVCQEKEKEIPLELTEERGGKKKLQKRR